MREETSNLVCGYHLAILRARPGVDGTYLFGARLKTREVQQQFHGTYANGVTRFGLRRRYRSCRVAPPAPRRAARDRPHPRRARRQDRAQPAHERDAEAMARALFKSWFVDFEPVRAKMEGRPSGLPPALDALFPASFEASELGQIPSGWGVQRWGTTLRGPSDGRSLRAPSTRRRMRRHDVKTSNTKMGGLHCKGRKGVPRADARYRSSKHGECCHRLVPTSRLSAEVAWQRSARPTRALTDHAALDSLSSVRGDQHLRCWYYLACNEQASSTPTRSRGTWRMVSKATYPATSSSRCPTSDLDARVHRALAELGVQARMTDLSGESAATAAQRDTLLPRLVSGEVRVGSGETACA